MHENACEQLYVDEHTDNQLTLLQQKTDTSGRGNTLLHRETLLVVTSRDTEDVSLEVIAKTVALDLVGDTLVKEADPE